MKTYTIKTRFYDSQSIRGYSERKEWENAIDSIANEGRCCGKGEEFVVSIYDIPEDSNGIKSWIGMVWHSAGSDRYATVDSIPDDWNLIDEQSVLYSCTGEHCTASAYLYI